MVEQNRVYVYTGNETGYTNGNWYYYDGNNWVSGGVYNSVAVDTDDTLSVADKAADAKAVGDEITALKEDLAQIVPGLSAEAKAALLACFDHVAWIDEHGQDYYDALYDALYEESPTPTPSFNYGVYEPDAVVNGKYIDENGDVQTGTTDTSFYIEDYIPVIRSNYWIGMNPSSLRVTNTYPQDPILVNESDWRVSEYDASKRFIKQTHFDSSNHLCASTLYEFDTNTKYIRLVWNDSNSSTNTKEFDIENPAEITVLPVEAGNIDATTGANAQSSTRIRSVGYIPVSNTITITGCPFYDTWSNLFSLLTRAGYSVSYAQTVLFYVVRCYNSNKEYLETLSYDGKTAFYQDISNAQLPTGRAYVRILFQFSNWGEVGISSINHLITINGVKYYMEGAS